MEESLKYLVELVRERDNLISDIKKLFLFVKDPSNKRPYSENQYINEVALEISALHNENEKLKREINQRACNEKTLISDK